MKNNRVAFGFNGPIDGVEDTGYDFTVLIPRRAIASKGLEQHPHGTAVLV